MRRILSLLLALVMICGFAVSASAESLEDALKAAAAMSNEELYDKSFMTALEVEQAQLADLVYQGIPAWDSVGHMTLIAEIEDAFDIMMDANDIVDFNSYAKGKEILQQEEYGISF